MRITSAQRLAEIEEFLKFALQQWPALSVEVGSQLSRRCTGCILSDRCSPLENGICQWCRLAQSTGVAASTEPQRHSMARSLSELLSQYQGRGDGKYDALVLFSGGKDSAFLLHRLHTGFPRLRLLALTVDNGFFSPVAMANCRRIQERIPGVDYLCYRPELELYCKTFRHAFTNLNLGGCYTTVDRMDGDLTFDIGRNFAASLQIPLLIAGLSPGQIERIFNLHSFETAAENERRQRSETAGFALTDIYQPDEIKNYWWNGSLWQPERVPRVLYPFYAWGYNEDHIRSEVLRLGLIALGEDNPLATNNDTIPLMLAVDSIRMGYSGFEPEFAELVRRGKAERQIWLPVFQALEYLSAKGRFLPKCLADTLDRLGLTAQEVGIPLEICSSTQAK